MAIEIVDLPITKGGFSLQSVNVYQRVKLLDVAGKSSNQSWRFSSLGNNYVRIHIYIYIHTHIYIYVYTVHVFLPLAREMLSSSPSQEPTTGQPAGPWTVAQLRARWEAGKLWKQQKRGTKPTKHRGISQTNSDLFSIWIL